MIVLIIWPRSSCCIQPLSSFYLDSSRSILFLKQIGQNFLKSHVFCTARPDPQLFYLQKSSQTRRYVCRFRMRQFCKKSFIWSRSTHFSNKYFKILRNRCPGDNWSASTKYFFSRFDFLSPVYVLMSGRIF